MKAAAEGTHPSFPPPTKADDDTEPELARTEMGRSCVRRDVDRTVQLEAGLPLEARQVAALERLVALCERIAAMAREQAEKDRKKSDEELAATINAIEHRMAYMARCEARRIAVDVIGLPQEEVDQKVPEPVWRDPNEAVDETVD